MNWVGRIRRGMAVVGVGVGVWVGTGARGAAPATDAVIVLANETDAASLRIARHYAEVRGVPGANVIALPMPATEEISWREFVATIWLPLLEQLVASGWIEATPMASFDPIGRRKYAPHGHRIAALVVCRGVPLKIAHDPNLPSENPPLTQRPEFRTNTGAVDAELSLLAQPNYPIAGLVPNPFYQNDRPSAFEREAIVKVGRLDGPTFEDANALVDRAIDAERGGLLGRAYVDLAKRDPMGDAWLDDTVKQLTALGFDTSIDHATKTLPLTARMDAPVLYFGWYARDINGPFTLPGFRFPPGAIALHIHSFSAETLRQADAGWTGAFVARGVTATVGNVFEPYLTFTHRPDLLLRALARGETLADAAYYSLPGLSWQAVLIGDPLFRPFAVGLDEQLREREPRPTSLANYAVLRQLRQLDAAGKRDAATEVAVATQRRRPSLALGVALAERAQAAADRAAVVEALEFVPELKTIASDQWALAREAARLLELGGRVDLACGLWRVLLGASAMPRELRLAWLPEAVAAARRTGDQALEKQFAAELSELAAN